jgi:hypothetical protein
MDVTAVGFDNPNIVAMVRQANDAGRAQGAALVQRLRQGQQQAAAESLWFAKQTLQGAATAANLVRLFGGDGRAILAQAQSALWTADADVKTLSDGVATAQASGATTTAQAEQQLDGLGATVQSLSGLAQAVIDSPVGYRADVAGQKPGRAVASLQSALTDMGNALAAGRFAILASSGLASSGLASSGLASSGLASSGIDLTV